MRSGTTLPGTDIELVTYVFTWHALTDACPKCRFLNGQRFVDPYNVFNEVVWSSTLVDVWDLKAGHSLVHPNCRCQLELSEINVDTAAVFGELKTVLTDLKTTLQEMMK